MPYKYESPEKRGYTRIYLTKTEHNYLFPYLQKTLFLKNEYYYKDRHFIAHHLRPLWWILLATIPVLIVGTLQVGLPEVWEDLSRAYRQRHYGSFKKDDMVLKEGVDRPSYSLILNAVARAAVIK